MIEVLDTQDPNDNKGGHRSLKDLITNGYKFEFGVYIEKAFSIWSKDIVGFSFYSLLMVIILVASALTLIGPLFLAGPLTAGYYIVAGKISRNEPHEFGDFFKGFDQFKELLVYTLILTAFSLVGLVLMLPAVIGAALESPILVLLMPVSYMLYIAFAIFLTAIYLLAVPFIVFGKFSAWTAMEASRKIVFKNFWWFVLLSFVAGIIAQMGMIAFLIGIFVTMSLQPLLYFSSYEDIIGLENRESEAKDITG